MSSRCRKAAIAACAVVAAVSGLSSSRAATLIENNQSAAIDGWNITAPTGVSLAVTSSGSEITIEKVARFTVPNQGFLVGFQPVSGASGAATSVDFSNEQIQNNTGSAFNGFQFLLLNTGSAAASFAGVGNVFAPPTGTGVNYTSVSLNASQDILTYTGGQNDGTTSDWGSASSGDNLLIDTPSGSAFALKELSQSGSGGGGGGNVVPLPSAAWQSLTGLFALGLFSIGKHLKHRRMA